MIKQLETFEEYTDLVRPLAVYPYVGDNILYPVLGLVGEAGEVAEKVKKLWRNFKKDLPSEYSEEEKLSILLELGDVLWYITSCAEELGTDLREVATLNATKLLDRSKRNVIKSEGDNR